MNAFVPHLTMISLLCVAGGLALSTRTLVGQLIAVATLGLGALLLFAVIIDWFGPRR